MSTIQVHIGNKQYQTEPGLRLGKELHQLAEITPPQQLAVSRQSAIDIPIGENDYIVVQDGDHFVIGDGDQPLPDNPCLRVPIPFCMNSEFFSDGEALQYAKILGAELKKRASGYQSSDGLFAELTGFADEPIRDDMRIIVQERDKFITVPCGNVGELPQQTPVVPLEAQVHQLKQHYPDTELIPDGDNQALIIHKFKLPVGWLSKTVDLMIQIPRSYPLASLDMFWLSPEVSLPSGQLPDRGDIYEVHVGKTWQRFSWHYTPSHPWNPSRDSLLSHIRFCLNRLNQIK